MIQNQRLKYLLNYLIKENDECSDIEIPKELAEQKLLFRSLVNIRQPKPLPAEILKVQDEYLKEEIRSKGITNVNTLIPVRDKVYIWQGDITTLECGAVVNAANSAMLGCFYPCHGCIDNAIHTYSGVQLRLECERLMRVREGPEPAGHAKITKAYNLPCQYIIHTVGPVISHFPTDNDCSVLKSCYLSCLKLAEEYDISSIAFCCISTGEFHFPNNEAAEIAVGAVLGHLKTSNIEKVIFNVFKDEDRIIYEKLLG